MPELLCRQVLKAVVMRQVAGGLRRIGPQARARRAETPASQGSAVGRTRPPPRRLWPTDPYYANWWHRRIARRMHRVVRVRPAIAWHVPHVRGTSSPSRGMSSPLGILQSKLGPCTRQPPELAVGQLAGSEMVLLLGLSRVPFLPIRRVETCLRSHPGSRTESNFEQVSVF
jgi:hypothetical protein